METSLPPEATIATIQLQKGDPLTIPDAFKKALGLEEGGTCSIVRPWLRGAGVVVGGAGAGGMAAAWVMGVGSKVGARREGRGRGARGWEPIDPIMLAQRTQYSRRAGGGSGGPRCSAARGSAAGGA